MCTDTPNRGQLPMDPDAYVTERKARERERLAYQAGHDDSDYGRTRYEFNTVDTRYPAYPPKMVTRPRVEVFGIARWKIENDRQYFNLPGDTYGWQYSESGPMLSTRADAERWLNLWNNPTETVPATD